MALQYVLGKATRHQPLEVVDVQPLPYTDTGAEMFKPVEYYKMRTRIYTTISEAAEAADRCAKWNPVGFVVLILNHAQNNNN